MSCRLAEPGGLISGRWQRPQPLSRLFQDSWAAPAAVILTASGKIVCCCASGPGQARRALELNAINNYFHWTAEVICAIVVVQLVWNAVQLILNHYRKRAAAMR